MLGDAGQGPGPWVRFCRGAIAGVAVLAVAGGTGIAFSSTTELDVASPPAAEQVVSGLPNSETGETGETSPRVRRTPTQSSGWSIDETTSLTALRAMVNAQARFADAYGTRHQPQHARDLDPVCSKGTVPGQSPAGRGPRASGSIGAGSTAAQVFSPQAITEGYCLVVGFIARHGVHPTPANLSAVSSAVVKAEGAALTPSFAAHLLGQPDPDPVDPSVWGPQGQVSTGGTITTGSSTASTGNTSAEAGPSGYRWGQVTSLLGMNLTVPLVDGDVLSPTPDTALMVAPRIADQAFTLTAPATAPAGQRLIVTLTVAADLVMTQASTGLPWAVPHTKTYRFELTPHPSNTGGATGWAISAGAGVVTGLDPSAATQLSLYPLPD